MIEPRSDDAKRFWGKIQPSDSGCWLWHSSKNRLGYGEFLISGKVRSAHRVAYELWLGPIPVGLDIDHLCNVRNCVNPNHLRACTRSENVMAPHSNCLPVQRLRMTHCKRGHEFTPENTIRDARNNARACRECGRKRWREYAKRKRDGLSS